jgi:hypothetical protein
MRFSNRVYNLVPDIYNTNKMEWEGVNIIILIRSKDISVKYNNIYKRFREYIGSN